MAGSAEIGSLRVALGIDSAQFATGIKKAQSGLGVLGASIKSFAIGAAAALSFAAITRSITSVIDRADELGKAAQKIGIPVEALSKLQYAADLADVSFEQLSTNVAKLSKNMAAIAGGSGGDAGKALAAIGVAVVDANGKMRSTSEVIADVAEKFEGFRDGAGKTALAIAIFGKSGAELIPLLNEGKKGLADSATEAENFGRVVTEKSAKAAEQFNDNMLRLNRVGQGFRDDVIVPLLPKLAELSEKFVEFAKSTEIKNFFIDLGGYIATTAREAQSLGIILTVMMENAIKSDGITAALERWKTGLSEIEKLKQKAGGISASPGSLATLMAGVETAITPKKPKTDAPIIKDIIPVEKVTALSEAFLQSQFDAKQLNLGILALSKGTDQLTESAVTLGQELAQSLGAEVTGWFDSAIDGTFKFKDALSDLIKQLAKVALNNVFTSLFTNASNPVQGGGLLGGIGKLFGFAKGGSFNVGGSGGIDSQLVAFKASPNERVSVTKPGQGMGGGANVNITVNAPNADGPGLASVKAELRNLQTSLPRIIRSTVTGEKSLNPGFAR